VRDIIENWQGTDAELLAELNAKAIKRKVGDGMVTLAMIGDLGVELVASLSLTLDMVIDQMPTGTQAEMAAKSMLVNFANRLRVSDRGLDFHNDVVRGQFTQILIGAGWQQASVDAVLGLGAVYESVAQQSVGRDAIQSDIDAVRRTIRIEGLQQRAVNASALFHSRAEQAQDEWDSATIASEWTKAWEDVG
jgi:hypothetical protein